MMIPDKHALPMLEQRQSCRISDAIRVRGKSRIPSAATCSGQPFSNLSTANDQHFLFQCWRKHYLANCNMFWKPYPGSHDFAADAASAPNKLCLCQALAISASWHFTQVNICQGHVGLSELSPYPRGQGVSLNICWHLPRFARKGLLRGGASHIDAW